MRQRRFTRGVFLFAVFFVAYMLIALALASALSVLFPDLHTGGDNGLVLIGFSAMALAVLATILFARRVPHVPTWLMLLVPSVVFAGIVALFAWG